jgi:phosphinothricin acetyltransferase
MTKQTDPVRIRLATADDLAAINEIYNYYVETSTCTYQKDPSTEAERAQWFAAHGERFPITVAESGDPTDPIPTIIGWGSLSAFRDRWGYRFTIENSVYVRHDAQRCGIGRALLADLIERARALSYHTIIAGISAEQAGSVRLHELAGFRPAGHFRQVGHKFDQWLDVLFLQLQL